MENKENTTVISAYLPPVKALTPEDLNLFNRPTEQTIVDRDLNAKHQNWHSLVTNIKGRTLFKHQQEHRSKYIIAAPEEPTHYLTMGTPDILVQLATNYTFQTSSKTS